MSIYWNSFRTFFKIGMFTLGGGYAMIPIIEAEVVDKNKWIEKEEFLDLIAIAQSCPGVFAVNISIFIGYKMRKLRGALCTCIGTALPSFLIILLIAMFFHQFQDNNIVAAAFRGGTHCRPHIQLGQECPHHTKHPLDTRCLRLAYLGNRRQSHLHHHRSRPLWLPLWSIYQAHRGLTQRELEQQRCVIRHFFCTANTPTP